MSEPKAPARPSQVTLAGWLVVAGSVVVVVMAFSRVAELRSLDTQEAIAEFLASPPGDSLGLSVSGVQTLLRIASMIAAACAAATAILGWHALQRSRGSRVALSLLAVPLFVTGFVGSGFAASVVTAAIVMLWFQPARDWFDGITRKVPTPLAPLPPPPTTPTGRDPLLDLPPPTAPPLHPTPYAAGPATAVAVPSRRPSAVTWACVLTWLFSVPAVLLFAGTIVALVADPNQLVDELFRQNPDLADQGMSDTGVRAVLYATSIGILVWSAAAVGLAVLVWRRVGWAAAVLRISAGGAAALCVLGVVTSFVFVLPLAACAATLALLLRPETRAWLRPGGVA